jgi:hypothetical protein
MVGSCTLSSRSLDGLPLAWGANAHASTCRRDLWYFADPWGSGGPFALGLGQRLSFFVGSAQEPTIIDSGACVRPTFIAPEPTVLILGSQ